MIPTAEEFWGRYYFRRSYLDKTELIDFTAVEEEEEHIEWGKEDESPLDESPDVVSENEKLKGIIRTLTAKISELEKDLRAKDELLERYAKKEEKIQKVATAERWKRTPVAIGVSDGDALPSDVELKTIETIKDNEHLAPEEPVEEVVPSSELLPQGAIPEVVASNGVEREESEDRTETSPPAPNEVHSAMRMLDEEAEEDDGWS